MNTKAHSHIANESQSQMLSDLADLPIWAARGAPGDVPKRAPINARTGGMASNGKPATWATRDRAERRAATFPAEREPGVGLMLGEAGAPNGLVLAGLDLDGAIDPESGWLTDWAETICDRLRSYAELSPSGTGAHVLFFARGEDVAALREEGLIAEVGASFSRGDHVEIAAFFGNKFLTVTDHPFDLLDETPIRPVSLDALRWLLSDFAPAWKGDAGDATESTGGRDESRSGAAWRFALDLAADGLSAEEIEAAMAAEPGDVGAWVAEKARKRAGQREIERTIRRAVDKAEADVAALLNEFEDLAPLGDDLDVLGASQKPAKPSRLEFLSPEECEAAAPRGYVIKGLLAPGDVGAIVGQPGCGKSTVAPFLAYAVARGDRAFGMRTRKGGAFYVAAEDETGMKQRVRALRDEHGDAPGFRLVTGLSGLLATDSPDLRALREAVKAERPALIVLDTIAAAFPGLEENDAAKMGRVVAVARALARWGAAVLLVHHDTKAGDGLPRGHSVLNGALDVSVSLKRDGKLVRGSLTKNRNGPCDLDLAFTIESREFGTDQDGDAITAALCEPLDDFDRHDSFGAIARPKSAPQRAFMDALYRMIELSASDDECDGVPEKDLQMELIASSAFSGADSADARKRRFRTVRKELGGLNLIEKFVRPADGLCLIKPMFSREKCLGGV